MHGGTIKLRREAGRMDRFRGKMSLVLNTWGFRCQWYKQEKTCKVQLDLVPEFKGENETKDPGTVSY